MTGEALAPQCMESAPRRTDPRGFVVRGIAGLLTGVAAAVPFLGDDAKFPLAPWLLAGLLLCIVAVSLATIGLDFDYHHRWTAYPTVLWTAQVPLLTAIIAWAFWRALRRGRELAPFLLGLALFALTYTGLGISMFPYVVPQAITVHDAASPDSSLLFMLVGAAVLIPVILAYTTWSYWVFRGKVGDEGYH